jgi:hypothetical protein
MIDQHSSLSLPFENPGREVIFHRWKKDMLRYEKLYKHYPVVPIIESRDLIGDKGIKLETKKTPKYVIEGGLNTGGKITQRKYQRTSERELLSKTLEIPLSTVKIPLGSISGSCIGGWSSINYTLEDEHIILYIPTGEPITLLSYDYKGFVKEHNLEVSEYFSEYFGSMPRRVICPTDIKDSKGRNKKIEVYDVFGLLISAKQINEKYDIWVCNIQWSMAYLMVKIFNSLDPKIVFTAEEQYLLCRQIVTDGEYPSIDVYGKYNITHSRLNTMKRDKEMIYGIKALQLQPEKMYPKQPACINNKKFDPETSEYFMTDARKLDGFIEWTTNPYPEYTNKSIRS